MAAAVRAGNVVVLDVLFHLFIGPAFTGYFSIRRAFDQLIGTVTGLALAAVHQRVGESLQVSGCFPDFRIHENRGLNLNIVRIFLDEFLLPGTFDMVF